MVRVLVFALMLVASACATGRSAMAEGTAAAAVVDGTVWHDQWQRIREAAPEGLIDRWLISNELNGEVPLLSALRRGRVAMGGVSFAILATADPALSVLSTPYLFPDDAAQERAMAAAEGRLERMLAERRLVYLGWYAVGPSHLATNRPVLMPGDAEGLRLRAPANIPHQAFLRALGTDPVAQNFGEYIPSLQSGLLDGGVATPIFHASITASLLPDYTLSGHIREAGAYVASAQWFNRLEEAEQLAVRALFAEAPAWRAETRAANLEAMEQIRAAGVTMHTPDPALWQAASSGVREAILEESGEQAAALLAILDAAVAEQPEPEPNAR